MSETLLPRSRLRLVPPTGDFMMMRRDPGLSGQEPGTQPELQAGCAWVCACVYVCMHVCMGVCVHVCMCVCAHVHGCVHVCACAWVCACVCVLVCGAGLSHLPRPPPLQSPPGRNVCYDRGPSPTVTVTRSLEFTLGLTLGVAHSTGLAKRTWSRIRCSENTPTSRVFSLP